MVLGQVGLVCLAVQRRVPQAQVFSRHQDRPLPLVLEHQQDLERLVSLNKCCDINLNVHIVVEFFFGLKVFKPVKFSFSFVSDSLP